MSKPHSDSGFDDKIAIGQERIEPDTPQSLLWTLVFAPFDLTLSLLSNIFALLRPISPQLIPLVVCLLFIPILILFSISAGVYVWSNVAVAWEAPVYLQYGDGVPPYAELMLPRLKSHQRYDVSLDLVIPTSEANYALGNFMSSLTLTNFDNNNTLAYVRRPTIVLAPNFGRLSFWKSGPPVSTQHVHLLDEFLPRTSKIMARIELGRRDGWKSIGNGEGRELSVISASLKGTIRYHGVRGLVTRFPVTSALISTIAFLTVSSIILAACLLPSVLNRRAPESIEGEEPPSTPPHPDQKPFIASPRSYNSEDFSDTDEKAALRKQRRKSRSNKGSKASSRHSSRSIDIKDEPSSSSVFPSVRRRRSRPFSEVDS